MTVTTKFAALRRSVLAAAPLALALVLAGCGDDNNDAPAPVVVTPAPSPSPSPSPSPTATPTPTGRSVTACLNQALPGGFTPATLVIPDTLKLNLNAPAGFPNGRRLEDPVIDVILAALLLDLTAPGQTATSLVGVLNPRGNEVPFLSTFPFLAPPNGDPPLASGTGTNFNFRTDPFTSYVRVDRMGQPAVATALIGSSRKVAYNDANPSDDAAGTFTNDIVAQLTGLHNALADDLIAASLRPCSS